MSLFGKGYGSVKREGTFRTYTKTKRSFKDQCDLNKILKDYTVKGKLPELIKSNPKYGDFSDVKEYQDSMNIVIHAREQFEALPSHIRKRFNNEPSRMLEFCTDPNNKIEMIKMGLAVEKQAPVTRADNVSNKTFSDGEKASELGGNKNAEPIKDIPK